MPRYFPASVNDARAIAAWCKFRHREPARANYAIEGLSPDGKRERATFACERHLPTACSDNASPWESSEPIATFRVSYSPFARFLDGLTIHADDYAALVRNELGA